MILSNEGLTCLKWENIRDNLRMELDLGRGNFFGVMDNITLESGKMERKMEVGIGNLKRVRATWENGKMDM